MCQKTDMKPRTRHASQNTRSNKDTRRSLRLSSNKNKNNRQKKKSRHKPPKIGQKFQVEVPDCIIKDPDDDDDDDRTNCVWLPNAINDDDLEEFLKGAKQIIIREFGLRDDLRNSTNVMLMDKIEEHALNMLHNSTYVIEEALNKLKISPLPQRIDLYFNKKKRNNRTETRENKRAQQFNRIPPYMQKKKMTLPIIKKLENLFNWGIKQAEVDKEEKRSSLSQRNDFTIPPVNDKQLINIKYDEFFGYEDYVDIGMNENNYESHDKNNYEFGSDNKTNYETHDETDYESNDDKYFHGFFEIESIYRLLEEEEKMETEGNKKAKRFNQIQTYVPKKKMSRSLIKELEQLLHCGLSNAVVERRGKRRSLSQHNVFTIPPENDKQLIYIKYDEFFGSEDYVDIGMNKNNYESHDKNNYEFGNDNKLNYETDFETNDDEYFHGFFEIESIYRLLEEEEKMETEEKSNRFNQIQSYLPKKKMATSLIKQLF